MAKAHTPLSTLGILREALILPKNNRKLILYVFLISLAVSAILAAVNQLAILPVLMDLAAKFLVIRNLDPMSPLYSTLLAAITKETKELAAMEIVYVIVAFFINAVVKTLIIYATAVVYTQQAKTLKGTLWAVKGMLKGPLLTQLLVSLLTFGYVFLLVLIAWLLVYISNNSIIVLLLVALVSLSASIWFVYLLVLWTISMTVSVLEQGHYGLGAIKRAMELVQGRKWKAVAILLPYPVVAGVVTQVYAICYKRTAQSIWLQMSVQFGYLVLIQALVIYIMGAFTVYYYDCRRCLGEENLNTADGDFVYTSLTADEVYLDQMP